MPIDPSKALGAELGSGSYEWTRDQVILYHLGVGAGVPAIDSGPSPLPQAVRKRAETISPVTLPTFAMLLKKLDPAIATTLFSD